MKINTRTVEIIDCHELDRIVADTYGRPYCFQQQDGCKDRGTVNVQVPSDGYDYENDTVPEVVSHPYIGVSFKAWLARDPKQPLSRDEGQFGLELWWQRNFYPSVDMVLNDLHNRGIIDAGDYVIDIDW
jgi:hypothetical protein